MFCFGPFCKPMKHRSTRGHLSERPQDWAVLRFPGLQHKGQAPNGEKTKQRAPTHSTPLPHRGQNRRKGGGKQDRLPPLSALSRLLVSAAGRSCGPERCCWWCSPFCQTSSGIRRRSVGKTAGYFPRSWPSALHPTKRKQQYTEKSVFFCFVFFSYFTRQELPAECQLAKSPGKLHGALL